MSLNFVFLILSFSQISQAQVLATVGDSKITVEDFKNRLNEIRMQTNNPPTNEQLLEEMVRFEVGLQEADKAKLKDEPLFKDRYHQLLYNSHLERQLGKKIDSLQVTEQEMKSYYEKYPQIHLAHILIEMKAGASSQERETLKKRAEDLLVEIKKSKLPFEQLVKLHSDDAQTKDSGGDIGYQSKATLAPIIYQKTSGMKPGEVSGIIETQFGFHIIKFLDRQSYALADKRQIRSAVYEDKRSQIFDDYFEKAKKSYRIEINKNAINSVTK